MAESGTIYYCSLNDVKAELNITLTTWDDILDSMREDASKFIDDYCKRTFTPSSSGTIRYYDGKSTVLEIDDCISVSALATDEDGDGTYENSLTENTDYYLYPLNTYPKTRLEINSNGDYGGFASGVKRGVKITGTWGYAASPPKVISRACLIQTCHWFKRKDSGYATVIGEPSLGQIEVHHGLDPDIKLLLSDYRNIRWAR